MCMWKWKYLIFLGGCSWKRTHSSHEQNWEVLVAICLNSHTVAIIETDTLTLHYLPKQLITKSKKLTR